MDWLNYHHLFYFWAVAKGGSLAKASAELRLAPPTLSAQVRQLEESFGQKLFQRQGRGLELTDAGRIALRYAEEIFNLGRELRDALGDRPVAGPLRVNVGVSDAVPKLIAYKLLEPAVHLGTAVRLQVREDHPDRLLAELSVHALDVVISDAPIPAGVAVRGFHHLLLESGLTFFSTPRQAQQLRRRFPRSLDRAPFLLPAENAAVRRELERWFSGMAIRPLISGEFDDRALLETFGQHGAGAFAASSAIEAEVRRQYGVRVIGRTTEVREQFYAISIERRLRHPAVVAICRTTQPSGRRELR